MTIMSLAMAQTSHHDFTQAGAIGHQLQAGRVTLMGTAQEKTAYVPDSVLLCGGVYTFLQKTS